MILATILAMQAVTTLPTGASQEASRPANEIWIDRPWEIRYIVEVLDRGLYEVMRAAALRQRAHRGATNRFQQIESLVEPRSSITVGPKNIRHVVALEFDREGKLLTKHNANAILYARRSVTDSIKLTGEDVPYFVAEWFQGLHDADTEFAPAVCDSDDLINRYRDDWGDDYRYGNFGCREWTYQLYNSTAGYIDVTSYGKRGASIGRFTGWARLTDPPRPVIGKHGKRWYCLYECPAGEQPGPIANIKAWTKQHGFRMPRGPHKQPEFPDKDFPGEWVE